MHDWVISTIAYYRVYTTYCIVECNSKSTLKKWLVNFEKGHASYLTPPPSLLRFKLKSEDPPWSCPDPREAFRSATRSGAHRCSWYYPCSGPLFRVRSVQLCREQPLFCYPKWMLGHSGTQRSQSSVESKGTRWDICRGARVNVKEANKLHSN